MRHLIRALALCSLSLAACDKPADDAKASPAAAGKPGELEVGFNRFGGDYKDFDLDADDPKLCQKACLDEARCKAFAYVKPGIQGDKARCWLKDSVPDKGEDENCVSGVK